MENFAQYPTIWHHSSSVYTLTWLSVLEHCLLHLSTSALPLILTHSSHPSSHFRLLCKVIGNCKNLSLMDTWKFLPVQVIAPFRWLPLLYFLFPSLHWRPVIHIVNSWREVLCETYFTVFSRVIPLDNINLASVVALTISPLWFDLCTKEIAFFPLPIKRWMQFLS